MRWMKHLLKSPYTRRQERWAEDWAHAYLSEARHWKGAGAPFEYPEDAELLAMPYGEAIATLKTSYLTRKGLDHG